MARDISGVRLLTDQLPLEGADLRLASLTDLPLDALIERIDARQ